MKKFQTRGKIDFDKPDIFVDVMSWMSKNGGIFGMWESTKGDDENGWSAYHLKLDDCVFNGAKFRMTAVPEDEENPEGNDLIVDLFVEDTEASRLSKLLAMFNFQEVQ